MSFENLLLETITTSMKRLKTGESTDKDTHPGNHGDVLMELGPMFGNNVDMRREMRNAMPDFNLIGRKR